MYVNAGSPSGGTYNKPSLLSGWLFGCHGSLIHAVFNGIFPCHGPRMRNITYENRRGYRQETGYHQRYRLWYSNCEDVRVGMVIS